MAVKIRAELKAENAADLPDNSKRMISAADLRGQLDDIVDSAFLAEDLNTPGGPVSEGGGGEDKADKTTTITGGELAIGGGDLSTDRVLIVPKASAAETTAGVVDDKAVTPFGLADTLSAIQARLDDLQAQIDALGDTTPGAPVNTSLPVISGTLMEGETLTVFIGTWTGEAPNTYARQWKRDGAAIAGGTGGSYVLQAADVGEMITVTVTATNTAGSASATSTAVGPILPIPLALILISQGQSLAHRRTPNVTSGVTVTDYFMPAGGSVIDDFPDFTGNEAHLQHSGNFETFVPFQEIPTAEGWGSGLGYQFRLNTDIGPMIFFCPAQGGRHWREIRPGTGSWTNMQSFVYHAYEYFHAQGEQNIGVRFFWTHGESESDTIPPGGGGSEAIATATEIQAIQEEVLKYYHWDMTLLFGRDMSALPMYVSPLNSAHYDDNTLSAVNTHPARGGASRRTQAGQLAAADANPKIILLPPNYQHYLFMDGDGVHMLGQGRRYFAELAATVAERVEGGGAYKPPHVLSATRVGAVITALCHFPGGAGGVRDTTTFADPGTAHWADQKYGIQFWDDTTAAFITVSDATISGSTLTVTLAAPPGGAGDLRIAQLPFNTAATGTTDWTARCNFRDASLSVTAENSTVLYHYMLPQTVRVT